jgi:hypothetical protein
VRGVPNAYDDLKDRIGHRVSLHFESASSGEPIEHGGVLSEVTPELIVLEYWDRYGTKHKDIINGRTNRLRHIYDYGVNNPNE